MSEFNENNAGDVVSGVDTVKKGKAGKIAAIAAGSVVAVGVVGSVAAYNLSDYVKNQVKLRTSSPEAYYSWIVEKNSAELSGELTTAYNEALDAKKAGQSSSFSVKYDVSGDARAMFLDEVFGTRMDDPDEETQQVIDVINGINSIAMGINADTKDTLTSGAFYAELNGERLATVEMGMDSSALDMFFRIPELSERWMCFDGSSMADDEDMEDVMKSYRKFLEKPEDVITSEEIKAEIERYTGVWNSTFDEVKLEKKEEVNIGGITTAYTVVTVEIDDEKAKQLAENMIKSAMEDEILKSVLVDRTESMTAEEFNEELSEALEDVKNEDFASEEGEKLIVKTFIDPKGGIRGVDIVDDEEEGNEFYVIIGKEGSEIRGEAFFMDGGEKDFEITMTAAEKNKKTSGSVELTYGEDESISVEFKDCEVVDEKKGYISGTYTLIIPEIDPISIAFNSDGKSQQISSQIAVEGKDFGKVTLEFASNDGGSPVLASRDGAFMISPESEPDMAEYVEKDKMAEFIADISKKIGFSDDQAKEISDGAVMIIYRDFDFGDDDYFGYDDDDLDWDDDDDDFDFDFETPDMTNKAYIYVADSNFTASLIGGYGVLSDGAVMADVTKDGTYTVSVKANENLNPKGFSILNVSIDEMELGGKPDIKIKSLKIDGKEIALTGEADVALMTGRISASLYTSDDFAFGDVKNIFDGASVGEWHSIEITFEITGIE